MFDKLIQNYKIFTDVNIHNPLCDYFDCNNILYNHLPTEQEKIALIDQLLYLSDNRRTLLIIGPSTLVKLIEQKSTYNNFVDLVDKKNKIKLIYYHEDSLTIFGKKYNIGFHSEQKEETFEIFKKLKCDWWGEITFGSFIKKELENKNFFEMHHTFFSSSFDYHHLFHCIKQINKTNTFFSLFMLHSEDSRRNRKILLDEIKNKYYAKDAIIKVNHTPKDYNDTKVFADINLKFGLTFSKNTIKRPIPVPTYYEKTYFELVCETLGSLDYDDTFWITEKTVKPIAMGHPFIVLSTKHFLKNLKKLGFKTFGNYIDESYDECDLVEDRIKIISRNLEKLNLNESKKFYQDTKSIREFNQQHLLYLHGSYKFNFWKNLNQYFSNLD